MYAAQSKKLLILDILSILKQYSDEEHRLSQKEILQLLKREYGMTADRKAVKRNLMDLMDFGFEIEYSETNRMVKNHKTGGVGRNGGADRLLPGPGFFRQRTAAAH